MIAFTDYSASGQSSSNNSPDIDQTRSPIPLTDAGSLQTSWEDSPLQRNETYLSLKDKEIEDRNINPLTVRSKNFVHEYLPNYRRLELENRALWDENHDEIKERLHPIDNWYRRHAICSQLELTGYQIRRVMSFSHTTIYKETVDGYSIDIATYCLCGLFCWDEGRPTHPNTTDRDEVFERTEAALGLTNSPVMALWNKLYNVLGL